MDRKEYKNKVVRVMIGMYCKAKHGVKDGLCNECQELAEYCNTRIDHCPIKETEATTCQQCKIHCYSKKQKEQIKKVMRFSGPRMIYTHPIMAIRHLIMEIF